MFIQEWLGAFGAVVWFVPGIYLGYPWSEFYLPKMNIFLGLPLAGEGSGSHSMAVHGSDSIILKAFPNLNNSIKSHSTDLELFPFMPKQGFSKELSKAPCSIRGNKLEFLWTILRERAWSFVSGPFYWELKHFQEPGGFFSPSATQTGLKSSCSAHFCCLQ